jgi:hypothetical protein
MMILNYIQCMNELLIKRTIKIVSILLAIFLFIAVIVLYSMD